MKLADAHRALDSAVSDEMGILLKVLVSNLGLRDSQALEKFATGFNSLVKAYDGASEIIAKKLGE